MGDRLEIRPATADDAAGVKAFLERLSPDSRWLRYHSPVPRIRTWMVDAVVSGDHEKREALLAIADGRIVGVAEWGRTQTSDEIADVGVVVDECCRRRGIARALMFHLAQEGLAHGVTAFHASVLSENRPTIGFVRSIAPERSVSLEGATVEIVVPLRVSA
jgi:ribosomal protein S18 acetylase RimI-like enzyme